MVLVHKSHCSAIGICYSVKQEVQSSTAEMMPEAIQFGEFKTLVALDSKYPQLQHALSVPASHYLIVTVFSDSLSSVLVTNHLPPPPCFIRR
jgi:hypothetical protein